MQVAHFMVSAKKCCDGQKTKQNRPPPHPVRLNLEVNANKTDVKSHTESSPELVALVQGQQELLAKQQQQLEVLTSMVQRYSQPQSDQRQPPHYLEGGRGFPRPRGYLRGNRGRGRGQGYRPIRCYNCNEEGHFARDCTKELNEVPANNANAGTNSNQANS